MAVQRNLWKPSFFFWPGFPCPSCKLGALKIAKKSISKEETASSKAAYKHEAWDPEWIEKRFNAILICANPGCEDSVFACGRITHQIDYDTGPDGETITELDEYYVPQYIYPALPVFPIPDECPNEVGAELKKAFALIWSDVGSGGNRLRVAVEALMNERAIQKRAIIKTGKNKGKYRHLTLHERIEKFAEKHEAAGTQLMAIKWLGNTGSHAALDVLSRNDLLSAFEHFEYALDLVYVKKDVSLVKRAKQIIKKKGPVRAKRKRRKRR